MKSKIVMNDLFIVWPSNFILLVRNVDEFANYSLELRYLYNTHTASYYESHCIS